MKAKIISTFRGSDGKVYTKANGFYEASEREITKLERAGCLQKISEKDIADLKKQNANAEKEKLAAEKEAAEKAEADKKAQEEADAKKKLEGSDDKNPENGNQGDPNGDKSPLVEGNGENSPQGSSNFTQPQGRGGNRRGGPANNP